MTEGATDGRTDGWMEGVRKGNRAEKERDRWRKRGTVVLVEMGREERGLGGGGGGCNIHGRIINTQEREIDELIKRVLD